MKTIAILIFDGVMASSIFGPADLFNISNTLSKHIDPNQTADLFDVRFLSVDDKPVQAMAGVTIEPTILCKDIANIDVLLIGGYHYVNNQSLIEHLERVARFNQQLIAMYQNGTTICAFCTGSFTLAQAGLLDDRQATVSWWLAQFFGQRFPKVELAMDKLVVQSDLIWTAGATTAYASLCIKLVEKMVNHQLASQLSRIMLIDNNRVSQMPYMSVQTTVGHNDKVISDCQFWLQENLASPISVKGMSEYCAMSERTFIRRFKAAVGIPPGSYLQQLRVDAAKQLLANTSLALGTIVSKVGYDDVSAFRRLFTKLTQLTPRAYRVSFSAR